MKLLIPMLIFADYGVPVVAASYLLTGRFNPEREFEKHPGEAEDGGYAPQSDKAFEGEQAQIVGTSAEWKRYRQELDPLLGERGGRKLAGSQRTSVAFSSVRPRWASLVWTPTGRCG